MPGTRFLPQLVNGGLWFIVGAVVVGTATYIEQRQDSANAFVAAQQDEPILAITETVEQTEPLVVAKKAPAPSVAIPVTVTESPVQTATPNSAPLVFALSYTPNAPAKTSASVLNKVKLNDGVPSVETASWQAPVSVDEVLAVKGTPAPARSQMAVIMAALDTVPEPQPTPALNTLFDAYRNALAAQSRPTPPARQMAPYTDKITPVLGTPVPAKLRPQTRPTQTAIPAAHPATPPDFSAKHFHDLRNMFRPAPSEIACVAELQLIAARTQIYFDSGSASVDSRGKSAARLIAARAQSCPEAELKIIGLTDPGGSVEMNKELSWKRANSVFKIMASAGFDLQRVQVDSHMEDHSEFCVHYEGIDRRVVFEVAEATE